MCAAFVYIWIQYFVQIDLTSSSVSNTFVNSTFINSTISGLSNQTSVSTHISFAAVPTIINGIATATSIIIGFSGTVVGIVARELLKDEKEERMKQYLIGTVLGTFPLIIFLFFMAYFFLLNGYVMVKTALQFTFIGFLFALYVLLGIFVFIALIIEQHKSKVKSQHALSSEIETNSNGEKQENSNAKTDVAIKPSTSQ